MIATVYLDVLFFLNAGIDGLLLLAVGRLTGAKIQGLRILLGALLGGVYGVCAVVWNIPTLAVIMGKLGVSTAMVLISYGNRQILRNTLVFWGMCFAYGGCVFAITWMSGDGMTQISVITILLAALLCYAIFALVLRYAAAKRNRTTSSQVKVQHLGITCEFCAMVDTGNRLMDPVTNVPIIVAELDAIAALLPVEVRYRLTHTDPESYAFLLPALPEAYRFRVIPYRTIGLQHAILLAFRPDRVWVKGEKIPGALLAISPQRISGNSPYQALVGTLE